MKKRVFSLLLALTLLLCALPLPAHAAANEITVYNWGQYISDGTDESLDVIQAFEEETGIKVNYLTFDSNESMYTKLKTGSSRWTSPTSRTTSTLTRPSAIRPMIRRMPIPSPTPGARSA